MLCSMLAGVKRGLEQKAMVGGHSALLWDVTGSSSRCGCAAAQIQIKQLFLEFTSCVEDTEISTSTAATLLTHYYKL
jgi:hypothetical protein